MSEIYASISIPSVRVQQVEDLFSEFPDTAEQPDGVSVFHGAGMHISTVENIENQLQLLEVPYDRYYEEYNGDPAEIKKWRPGMNFQGHIVYPRPGAANEHWIMIGDIRKLLEELDKDACYSNVCKFMSDLRELLDQAEGRHLRPLESYNPKKAK